MKIRTQFIITASIFVISLIVTAVWLILTTRQVNHLNEQAEIVHRIEQAAGELSYLSNEYLLYRERQQRTRWEAKSASLSEDLARLKLTSPDQQALVDKLKANQQRLKAVFESVVTNLESPAQPQEGGELAVVQVSWSRMAIQHQSMIFDAALLSLRLREQADALKQTNIGLIVLLVGLFGAYLLLNYLMIYRRALSALAELQAGTQTIGSGDLNFIIADQQADEIGELARAFNRMTTNLRDITTSKVDLEREITERKRAEQQIKASLQEKEVLLREVHHRVRNNLQGILNLLYLQALHLPDAPTRLLFQQTEDRIHSIALIHETLYNTQNLAHLNLNEYVNGLVKRLLSSYGLTPAQIRLDISIDHVLLNLDTAVPLGVIINELVSNALKHAFPSASPVPATGPPHDGVQVGEIAVELRGDGQRQLVLTVRDNGVGVPADINITQPTTLGLQLVSLLAHHMGGTVEYQQNGGTTVTVTLVPLPESSYTGTT